MAEKRQFRAIKGTRDILPPDSSLWNWFERAAREVFESYNFREIRVPIFEPTELFARSIGADTDVVGKEMYTFVEGEEKLPNPTDLGVTPENYYDSVESAIRTRQLPPTPSNDTAFERLKFQMDLYNT